MIELGEVQFKYKKQAMEYVREFLQRHEGSIFDQQSSYFNFFNDLVKRHPEREINNLEQVEVIKNFGGYPAINIKEVGKDFVSISWNKCITGNKASYKLKLRMAMRRAIIDQIMDFKDSCNEYTCSICNEDLTEKVIHVDHEKYFEEIAKEFEETFGKEWELVNLRDHNGWQFKNDSDSSNWQKFHQEKATLRLTCSKCNLSRR
jgi:hypothetical protein